MSDRRPRASSKEPSSSQPGKRRAPIGPLETSDPQPNPLSKRASRAASLKRQPAQQSAPSLQSPTDAFQVPQRPQSSTLPYQQQQQQQQQSGGKVAIPRLRRDSNFSSATTVEKHRVAHACEPCRHRKTKCSGERPVCKHCEDFKINCVYADGKRDRTKKEIGQLAEKLEEYERILRDLSFRASDVDQSLIRRVLQKEQSPESDDLSSAPGSRRGTDVDGVSEPGGETRVSARVGSTGSMDVIEEDFNKSAAARATGFMGKNSEVVWMQRLSRRAAAASGSDTDGSLPGHAGSVQGGSQGAGARLSDSTYHCDTLSIMVSDQVDAYELPPKHIADFLFQTYLDIAHPAFPILGRATFTNQYKTFSNSQSVNTGDHWRAILNLIFAIAARYTHLIQAEWRGDERDHLVYFTRARILGLNGDSILAHPDLQQVQISGLMAFYLAATDQINRAWTMSGIAIRHAATLGLNLQNEDKNITDSSKEVRYRVWWALCSTERMLAVMTGRPTSFLDADCSTPLPLPVEEDSLVKGTRRAGASTAAAQSLRRYSSQESRDSDPPAALSEESASNPGTSSRKLDNEVGGAVPPSDALFFLCHTKLSILTNTVLNRLYRAGTSKQTWAEIQGRIAKLDAKLERWRQSLLPIFDFTKKHRDQQFIRQRICLGFFYYNTRTIINRPCLCRVDRRIPQESGKSMEFNRTAAARCVHAARDLIDMLPNEPNAVGLDRVSPWWCLVHHLVQATTVLMLELSFRADHMPNEADDILEAAKKGIYWLRSMSEDNVAARRAWRLCAGLLPKVAPKIGRHADNLPDGIPPPAADYNSRNITTDPAQPGSPSNYTTGPGLTRPSQVYSAYDEFLGRGSPPNFSSIFPPMDQTDTNMYPSAPGDLDYSFVDGEQQWDGDELR